jgi:hypothetical protein
METRRELLARRGLILARHIVRRLDEVGIYAHPDVSLEHQHIAKRYVLRAVESGGAICDFDTLAPFDTLIWPHPTENHIPWTLLRA